VTALLILCPLLHASALRLPYTTRTLDNGLQVIVHEDHRAPLFAAELRYRVGAAGDPIPGLAHLVEHLMFEGSASAPQGAYDRWLAAAGASNNAWTSHDTTAFTVVGPAEALELALFLEGDRMGWLTLDEEDLINQLAVVFSERELSLSAVGGWETPSVSAALYPAGHPYRRTVLGEPEPLSEVTIAQLADFVSRWYQPANAVLVVGGAVSAEAVFALAEQHLGIVPATSPPAQPAAAPVSLGSERRRVLYDEVAPTLEVVWPTVPRGHADEAALDMLSGILHNRLSARGRVWTENRRLSGRLVAELTHPRGGLWRLRRRLDREVASLKSTPVSVAELARVQARWRTSYVRGAEGLEERVSLLAGCALDVSEPDCIGQILSERDAVSPEEVQAAAQAYLGDGRLLLSEVPLRQRRWALRGSAEVVMPW